MTAKSIDTTALQFNQISIVVLVLTGYILDLRVLPAIVAAILLAGVIDPRLSLFRWIYRGLVVPAGILTPQVVEDDGSAHRFAQFLGGLTLSAASIALFAGSATAGWILAWVVVVLAGVNLAFGFCTGCFLYYLLRRRRPRHSATTTHGA